MDIKLAKQFLALPRPKDEVLEIGYKQWKIQKGFKQLPNEIDLYMQLAWNGSAALILESLKKGSIYHDKDGIEVFVLPMSEAKKILEATKQ
jgi:hypothetical protein